MAKAPKISWLSNAFNLATISLLSGDEWIEASGPQQLTISDAILSHALTALPINPYGDCMLALGSWTLDLNGVAGFCTWNGQAPPLCNNGYVDVNITSPGAFGTVLNLGGLRLTPTALPFDDCHIECTVYGGNATPYRLTIHRMVGSPITLNSVSAANFSNWPLAVSAPGPQSFGLTLPANTVVTVGAQTYTANGATFDWGPTPGLDFPSVCLKTTLQSQMSFKSYHTTRTNIPLACLTLNCPTNVIVNLTNESGTVVTFNPAPSGATRCGSNVVVTCVPPSGSVFPPGASVVFCSAIDSLGNQDQCRFLVTVQPPPQLRTKLLANGQLELRWTGEAIVETTEALNDRAVWQTLQATPRVDGLERVLVLPAAARQGFFRTRPLPL